MFQIRQCRSEDFGQIVELLRQLWPEKHLDVASLQTVFDRALASDLQVYLCATKEQRIVGFGSLTLKNNLWQEGYLAHVDELIVDKQNRGCGMGTRLLEELVAAARQWRCRRVELDSAFHRRQAHEFYQRHGFEGRAVLFSRAL